MPVARQQQAAAPRWPRVVPPTAKPATRELSLVELLSALRRNVLNTWGAPAYELEAVQRPFLGRQSVMLNAPDAIRRVLIDNHANYGRTAATVRVIRPLFGDGLFISEGEAWRHQRRTLAPAFAPRALDVVARHAAQVADETVAELAAGPRFAADLLRPMQRATLEVAGRAMFSLGMAKYGASLRGLLERYGRRYGSAGAFDLLLPGHLPSPSDFPRRRISREWFALVERILAERAAQPSHEPARDLFDVMSNARDPKTGEGFSRAELAHQVATLILAGHETTALTLFWALHLLALAPEVQDDLAAEAAGVDLSAEAAPKAAARLPLTAAVVQETLRLYPPAYTIVRAALGPDEVAGMAIEPGALVMVAPWILHRHRRRWHDPDAFDPTRFLPGAPAPDRFAYLPFGVGPRVCIGAQFALIEANVMLAKLVRAFRIELVERRRPVRPVAIVTVYPERVPAFRLRGR